MTTQSQYSCDDSLSDYFSWFRSVSIYDIIRPWRSYSNITRPVWVRAPCIRHKNYLTSDIFMQSHCIVTSGFSCFQRALTPSSPFYATTCQKFNHRTPKKLNIFLTSFWNTMPNFKRFIGCREKHGQTERHTNTSRNIRFSITDVR